ncbi:putative membrane protein [Brucella thiophenivorans]|uniref:Putative membrane protein n=1 Tax=Brucella thiophenivorans TaxID=571255 RepID=A0A256EZE0_9HYPH|nr:putative membrane protein [Brucella thiophenivorans]
MAQPRCLPGDWPSVWATGTLLAGFAALVAAVPSRSRQLS